MKALASVHPLPLLRAAADSSRLRLIRILDLGERSVGELAAATDIAQSTVSRHLALLAAASIVEERSEGVRTFVRIAKPSPDAAPFVEAVLAAVRDRRFGHDDDLARLDALLRQREAAKDAAFDELAADWDTLRGELLGGALSPPELSSLLVPRGLRIVDAGAGTGLALAWLSAVAGPHGEVIAVERSAAMAARARARARDLPNVEVRRGRIEDLPVPDRWADGLILSLSLRQTADPAAVLARCVRAVRAGGRVVVADVLVHGATHVVDRLGPGFAGFAPEELVGTMRDAGLEDVRLVPAEVSSHENNGSRKPRSRDIPRLAPLLAVGFVPARADEEPRATRRTR